MSFGFKTMNPSYVLVRILDKEREERSGQFENRTRQ